MVSLEFSHQRASKQDVAVIAGFLPRGGNSLNMDEKNQDR